MTRDKLLEHSLGSVARRISDAQPGALADAMEALEQQRKLLSPLTDAARLAELAAPAHLRDEISKIAGLCDPLGEASAALGIERSAIENPALSIAKGMEHALGLPDITTRNELDALHGTIGIKNDPAETARQLKDHLGVDPSILEGDLSLRKAASGAIGEINGLQDAIKAAAGSLNVLEEHKRMSDLLDTAQPYRGAAYDAAADALSTVSAPSARSVPAPPSRSGGARKKVTSAKAIGELVREARRKMKLSQQDFADLAGVGRRFVSELEAGKPTLEFDKVMQACAAAGIDVTAASRSAS
jgi:y4mF family transcriptional regulator